MLRPVVTSEITQQVGRHEQGVAIGISGSLSSLAMTIAPAVGGSLLDLAGPVDHLDAGWLQVWTLVPATAAALGLIVALIRRARRRAVAPSSATPAPAPDAG
jgi:MFS family permease